MKNKHICTTYKQKSVNLFEGYTEYHVSIPFFLMFIRFLNKKLEKKYNALTFCICFTSAAKFQGIKNTELVFDKFNTYFKV